MGDNSNIPGDEHKFRRSFDETNGMCIKKKSNEDFKKSVKEGIQIWECSNDDDTEFSLPLEVSCIEAKEDDGFIQTLLNSSKIEGLCSRNYTCHHCGIRKRSVKLLKTHIKKSHLTEPITKESGRIPRTRKRKRRFSRHRVRKASNRVYPCPFCNYTSRHLFVVRNHVLGVHTNSKPFQCTFCDYSTAYSRALQTHIRGVHTQEKPYKCNRCRYATSHSSHLKSHLLGVHSGERPYLCSFCEYSTAYSRALRVHTMAHHTGERPFSCSDCDYRSAHSSDLKLHVLNHHRTNDKPHQCPFCTYCSAQSSHMKTHITAVHMKERSHKCPFCSFSSAYPLTLKSHISNFHGEEAESSKKNSPYVQTIEYPLASGVPNDLSFEKQAHSIFVDYINSSYKPNYKSNNSGDPESAEFDSDSSNIESSEAEDPLSMCGTEISEPVEENLPENYETVQSAQSENTEHADPLMDLNSGTSGPEIVQVALNPFDYALPSSFEDSSISKKRRKRKRERSKVAIQDKQYPCPQCSSSFPKSKHLMYHMKVEHPGVKSFPCTQCDFSAPKSSLLKYHVQSVHKAAAGATVHQCPKCPYCTSSAEKLCTHIRVKHNRIRPYKCPQCSYSSTQAGHIKIHVRAKHTDEKPYHCNYCGYQSAYASALKSHITKRHTNN